MKKSLSQELRQVYFPSLSNKKDNSFDQYIQFLTSKGLKFKNSLFPSYFQLQNGLSYTGIATKEQIGQNQQLVRVPNKLIMTSFKALQCKQLEEIYQQKFYHNSKSWEYRILATFSLFLHQKKDESDIFYQMINNLPKEIDLLCFWSNEQLDKFKDLTVKRAAIMDLQYFQQQWNKFQQIQDKYQLLKSNSFTKQNYRWIFIHLNSRSFGKYVQFASMVPFCQLFNHHSSKVYYTVDSIQSQKKQFLTLRQKQKIEEQLESISSQGSYESQDYFQVGQFDYSNIDCISFQQKCEQCSSLRQQQKTTIKSLTETLLKTIQEDVKLTDFSILLVGQLIQRVKQIYRSYLTEKVNYQKTFYRLNQIQICLKIYLKSLADYYYFTKGKSYNNFNKNNQIKQTQSYKRTQIKQKDQFIQFPKYQKKFFDYFLLKTSKRDKFKANNQVYFRYGKDSNRTLLLWYGFAILGNKYEHVWICLDIANQINKFPDIAKIIQNKTLSLKRKFRICHNRLNMDIIMFLRLQNWKLQDIKSIDKLFEQIDINKQVKIIEEIKKIYQNKIQQYKGDYNLKNPNLSYHEYFIEIYHIQKINILKQQINYLNTISLGLKNKQNGQNKQQSFSHLTTKQEVVLRNYLKMI